MLHLTPPEACNIHKCLFAPGIITWSSLDGFDSLIETHFVVGESAMMERFIGKSPALGLGFFFGF